MPRFWILAAVLTAILGHLSAQRTWGFATEQVGNEPLSELNYAEWKGIMPIVNDQARVYETWANGNERLYYKATTEELNASLAHFAKMEVEHHVVVLRPGSPVQRSFNKTEIPFNWELQVIGGLARRYANSNKDDLDWQKDPVLTVYVGGDIDLEKLDIPKGVTLATRPEDSEHEEAKAIAEFLNARKKEADK